MSARRQARWVAWAALVAAPGCGGWGPDEVQAAGPSATSAPAERAPAREPHSLRAPALPPGPVGPPAPAPLEPDEVVDLAQLVAWLEDEQRAPPILTEEDLTRLFFTPPWLEEPGLQAGCVALDVVGSADSERVALISEGWHGQRFWVCLFLQLQGCWRLGAHVRLDGPCRGVPDVEVLETAGRRWIRVEWLDGFEGAARTTALALLELGGPRLTPVLRATTGGHRPGGPRSLSVSHQLNGLELEPMGDAVWARLDYGFSAGAAQTGLGDALWVGGEALLRLRQPRPGEPFEPVEPAGLRALDAALFDTLALEAWLREHAELTGRMALEGTTAQQLALLDLTERMLEGGGSSEARALIALLPPRAELEAAAAAIR